MATTQQWTKAIVEAEYGINAPIDAAKQHETNAVLNAAGFRLFRKRSLTLAKRITEPFEVVTSEGTLACENGWLAIDARGYPYPIADDEFRLIYEEYEEAK